MENIENEKRNYIKEYYSKQEHNLKELVENLDLSNEEEIKSIKREILKLQKQIELKKIVLSKTMETSYNKQYTPTSKKILLCYTDRNNNSHYYDLLSGSEEEDTTDSIIYSVDTKIGKISVLVGYDYELASLITKEYSYKISKDNDSLTTKFLKENIISFMEDKFVSYNVETETINEHTKDNYNYSTWDYIRPLERVNDYEFINTFYNVDYKGNLNLRKLREYNLKNKSFEIILKTCPSEIIDNLLSIASDFYKYEII